MKFKKLLGRAYLILLFNIALLSTLTLKASGAPGTQPVRIGNLSQGSLNFTTSFDKYIFKDDNPFIPEGVTKVSDLIAAGEITQADLNKLTPYEDDLLAFYYVLHDVTSDEQVTQKFTTLKYNKPISDVVSKVKYGANVVRLKKSKKILLGSATPTITVESEIANPKSTTLSSTPSYETSTKTLTTTITDTNPTYIQIVRHYIDSDTFTRQLPTPTHTVTEDKVYMPETVDFSDEDEGPHEHRGKTYYKLYHPTLSLIKPDSLTEDAENIHRLNSGTFTKTNLEKGKTTKIHYYYISIEDFNPTDYVQITVNQKYLNPDLTNYTIAQVQDEFMFKKGATASLPVRTEKDGVRYLYDADLTGIENPRQYVVPQVDTVVDLKYRKEIVITVNDKIRDLLTDQEDTQTRVVKVGQGLQYSVPSLTRENNNVKPRRGVSFTSPQAGTATDNATLEFLYDKVQTKDIQVREHFVRTPSPSNPYNTGMEEDRYVDKTLNVELGETYSSTAETYENYTLMSGATQTGIATKDTVIVHEYQGQKVTANVNESILNEATQVTDAAVDTMEFLKGQPVTIDVPWYKDDLHLFKDYTVDADGAQYTAGHDDTRYVGKWTFTPTTAFNITKNFTKPVNKPFETASDGKIKAAVKIIKRFDDKAEEVTTEYKEVNKPYAVTPEDIPNYTKNEDTVEVTGTLTKPIEVIFNYTRIKHTVIVNDIVYDDGEPTTHKRYEALISQGESYTHLADSTHNEWELQPNEPESYTGTVNAPVTINFKYNLVKGIDLSNYPKTKDVDGTPSTRVIVTKKLDDAGEPIREVKYLPTNQAYNIAPTSIDNYTTSDEAKIGTLTRPISLVFNYQRIKHNFIVKDVLLDEDDGHQISGTERFNGSLSQGDTYTFKPDESNDDWELTSDNTIETGTVEEAKTITFTYKQRKDNIYTQYPKTKLIQDELHHRVLLRDKFDDKSNTLAVVYVKDGESKAFTPTNHPYYDTVDTEKTQVIRTATTITFNYTRRKHTFTIQDEVDGNALIRETVELSEGDEFSFNAKEDDSTLVLTDASPTVSGTVTEPKTITFHYTKHESEVFTNNPLFKLIDGKKHYRVIIIENYDDKESKEIVQYLPLDEEFTLDMSEEPNYTSDDAIQKGTLIKPLVVEYNRKRIKHEFKIYDTIFNEATGKTEKKLRETILIPQGDDVNYSFKDDNTEVELNEGADKVYKGKSTEPKDIEFKYTIYKDAPFKTTEDGKQLVRVFIYLNKNGKEERITKYVEVGVKSKIELTDLGEWELVDKIEDVTTDKPISIRVKLKSKPTSSGYSGGYSVYVPITPKEETKKPKVYIPTKEQVKVEQDLLVQKKEVLESKPNYKVYKPIYEAYEVLLHRITVKDKEQVVEVKINEKLPDGKTYTQNHKLKNEDDLSNMYTFRDNYIVKAFSISEEYDEINIEYDEIPSGYDIALREEAEEEDAEGDLFNIFNSKYQRALRKYSKLKGSSSKSDKLYKKAKQKRYVITKVNPKSKYLTRLFKPLKKVENKVGKIFKSKKNSNKVYKVTVYEYFGKNKKPIKRVLFKNFKSIKYISVYKHKDIKKIKVNKALNVVKIYYK